MAGAQVLAKRAGAKEHEASVKAYTTDLADKRRLGQDYEVARSKLREGIDASRRVHVPYDRSGGIGGKRVRGAAVGRHGTFQGVVEQHDGVETVQN